MILSFKLSMNVDKGMIDLNGRRQSSRTDFSNQMSSIWTYCSDTQKFQIHWIQNGYLGRKRNEHNKITKYKVRQVIQGLCRDLILIIRIHILQ